MKRTSIIMIAIATILTGCSMAPEYVRPELPVADQFPAMDAKTVSSMKLASWKEYFNDPRLNKLIALTLENNRDLRVASLNIQRLRAEYGVSEGSRLPDLGMSGGNSRKGSLLDESERTAAHKTSGTYNVSFGISSYELDFFGRLKSLRDAALNKYLASEEGRKSAQIAMISQVAQLYVNEQLSQEQLALSRNTLSANQSSYKLIKQQVDAGIASDLDLKQAETQVLAGKIAVAVAERQSMQALNKLNQVVGVDSKELPKGFNLSQMRFGKNLPVGLPSEVLLKRPDIIEAERNLMAANANIGAARAAFFPRISLTSTIGYISPVFSDLVSDRTGSWNTGISGTLPIFAWGKNMNNLEIAKLSKGISVAQYEKAVQTAFREVADALVAKRPLDAQVKSQVALAAAEQERLNLSQLLYNNGVASYLDVLDAQRTLFNARQNVLTARTTEITNSINLFAALGGGYDEPLLEESAKKPMNTSMAKKNSLF